MEEQKLLKRKSKALKENNTLSLISATLTLAEHYFKEGQYERAIDEFGLAAKKNKLLNNVIDYARCHRMIGEAYVNLREFEKALEHQKIHLQISKQEKNKLEEQRALATIGHIYLTSYLEGTSDGDKTPLNLAYKSFMKSLAVCESLTDISKREHMDMLARLFANLGVVQEFLGDFIKGVELLQKSVKISKAHDIYEQLQRGYTLLGSLFTKMGNYRNAIHQYNLSIEVAGRLEDKISLTCSALTSKADLLVKLGDFHGAKSVLLKAHKLKNPSRTERETIENGLKTIAAMCYTEDELLTVSETDYKARKKLYERIGDGASELKNFAKAIEYYKKMLDSAKKAGESGSDLSPCYVSLAQTYLDNKQYDLAIEYFEKDFAINQNNTKETINTLFSIIDAMKGAEKDFREIECIYEQARALCKRASDVHLEGKVVARHQTFLAKNNDAVGADNLQSELDCLNYVSSDEDSDLPHTPTIGDDVNIDDITDVSDNEDVNQEKQSRATRKRAKTFSIKRNNKGETQLHTACIAGNLILVTKLLEQGHAVNVRDNCGWLPIHEACINGHLEIVRLLIEKGAAINDRGGTLCNGMTPLHDAASNGHLEVIELLLDKGANAVSKTDEGETPLHILKRWREKMQLNQITERYYETILHRMSEVLEKSGQNTTAVINKDINNSVLIIDQDEPFSPSKRENENRKIGRLRRYNTIESSEDSESSNQSVQDVHNAKNQYKEVMQSLRTRSSQTGKRDLETVSKSSKRSALLTPEEVGDDWLEDDLGLSAKKRKTTTGTFRRSIDMECQVSEEEISDSSSRSSSDVPLMLTKKKRKRQVSLITSGFTRKRSESSVNLQCSPISPQKKKLQTKMSNFTESVNVIETDFTTNLNDKHSPPKTPNSQRVSTDQTLFVDIRIIEKLYRVPVPYSQINNLTIQWLAEEAAKRYSRKECMKPTLELQTKNGAILAEDDPLNILFPMGSAQSEEIIGNVLKWNLQAILERYRESCAALCLSENSVLSKILQETSTTLNLSNKNFDADTITPLCRALNRQMNLVHLDLSGNFSLKEEALMALSSALPSLQNLSLLNLSNTNIDAESLAVLSQIFSHTDTAILENLVHLDLSHNSIGNDGLPHLAIITRHAKLKTLLLRDVDFSGEIFDNITNECVELYLDFLEHFDISYNEMDKNDIMKFLSWIRPNGIEILDVSNNLISEAGLVMEIVCLFQTCDNLNIKKLNFTRCKTTDSEVCELLNVLQKAPSISELNLSYNEELTSISLRRILQCELKLKNVTLIGCDSFIYFDNTWDIYARNLKSVTLTVDLEKKLECDRLVAMWKAYHNYNCNIRREVPNLLQLTSEM